MIDTIKGFMDREYYTEASFLLSDLSNTASDDATKAEVSELQNKLNELYDPEKENSFYNSDVIVPVKDFTGKYGYIDHTGNLNFQDGAAWVSTKDGFYGQIDKSGNRIFDTKGMGIENVPSYLSSHGDRTDGLTYFLLARAIGGDEPDRDAVIFSDINNKRVIVRIENRDTDKSVNGMTGAKDVRNYQRAVSFANGRTFIRTRYDGWAMIDMKGNMIVQP